jgi:thiamine kinase-like enzyme
LSYGSGISGMRGMIFFQYWKSSRTISKANNLSKIPNQMPWEHRIAPDLEELPKGKNRKAWNA